MPFSYFPLVLICFDSKFWFSLWISPAAKNKTIIYVFSVPYLNFAGCLEIYRTLGSFSGLKFEKTSSILCLPKEQFRSLSMNLC
jgi:hypothetical protein